jgi:hypothetical protein
MLPTSTYKYFDKKESTCFYLFQYYKNIKTTHNIMKHLFIVIAFLLLIVKSYGQTANNYTYSTSTGATLEAFTTANSTSLISACSDEGRSAVTNIGFTFPFEGVNYTQFSVNANGLVTLGAAQVVTNATNTNFGTTTGSNPKITALWDDLFLHLGTTTAGNSWVRFMVTGAVGSRVLKIDYRARRYRTTERDNGWCGFGSTFYNFNIQFQVWLYETTGVIEFRYGAGVAQASFSTGISGATGTNYLSVVSSSHTASNTTRTTNNTTWPGNGRMYRFVGCTAPTNITLSATQGATIR